VLSTDGTIPRSIGFCGNSSSYGGRVLVVACDSMRRTDLHHRPPGIEHPGEGTEDHRSCTGDDYDDDDLNPAHGIIVSTVTRGREYSVCSERDRHRFSYEFFTPAATAAAVSSRSFVSSPLARETTLVDSPVAVGIVRPVSHASAEDRSLNDAEDANAGQRSCSPRGRTGDGKTPADEAADGGGGRGRSPSSAAQKLEELFSPPPASETGERNGTLATTLGPVDGSGTAARTTDIAQREDVSMSETQMRRGAKTATRELSMSARQTRRRRRSGAAKKPVETSFEDIKIKEVADSCRRHLLRRLAVSSQRRQRVDSHAAFSS
jgi:hypothetical protein